MSKFDDCVIIYTSGKGESFIERVLHLNRKQMEITDEEKKDLEEIFHSYVFKHNHNDKRRYGYILIISGLIQEEKYNAQC